MMIINKTSTALKELDDYGNFQTIALCIEKFCAKI